jgi:hypothetical protein
MNNEYNDDLTMFNEIDNYVNEVINELIKKYANRMMIKHYIYFAASLEFKIRALMYKEVMPKLLKTNNLNSDKSSDIYA